MHSWPQASPLGLQALSSWASMTVTSNRPIPLVFRERAKNIKTKEVGNNMKTQHMVYTLYTEQCIEYACVYLGMLSLSFSSPSR